MAAEIRAPSGNQKSRRLRVRSGSLPVMELRERSNAQPASSGQHTRLYRSQAPRRGLPVRTALAAITMFTAGSVRDPPPLAGRVRRACRCALALHTRMRRRSGRRLTLLARTRVAGVRRPDPSCPRPLVAQRGRGTSPRPTLPRIAACARAAPPSGPVAGRSSPAAPSFLPSSVHPWELCQLHFVRRVPRVARVCLRPSSQLRRLSRGDEGGFPEQRWEDRRVQRGGGRGERGLLPL